MPDQPSAPRKRLSLEDRVAALDARRKALTARLSEKRRTEDTRACILLGRWVMEAAKRDPQVARAAVAGLPKFLTRDHDRTVMARTLAELTKLANGTPGQKPSVVPAPVAAPAPAPVMPPKAPPLTPFRPQ